MLTVLTTFLLDSVVHADVLQKFAGSAIKTEDIVLKCDAVFVGEIKQMGFFDPESTNTFSCGDVQVKVLQVLRGTSDPLVKVEFEVRYGPSFHESVPKLGNNYIFFAQNAPGTSEQFTILKLIPATDDEIVTVKKLISSQPKN